MKKTLLFICIIIFAIFPWQGCGNSKKINRSKSIKDSTHVVNSTISVKNTNTDSNAFTALNKFYAQQSDADLSIEKINKIVESEPGNLSFILNIDELKPNGDSLTTTDINTGTRAIIYKDKKTGNILFNVKHPGKRKETFEMQGLRLIKKNTLDSGTIKMSTVSKKSVTKDSAIVSKDSNVVKSEAKIFNKDVKKKAGFLKWLGIVVLLTAVLRLAIWLLRKKWPWVGWLNNLLGGK